MDEKNLEGIIVVKNKDNTNTFRQQYLDGILSIINYIRNNERNKIFFNKLSENIAKKSNDLLDFFNKKTIISGIKILLNSGDFNDKIERRFFRDIVKNGDKVLKQEERRFVVIMTEKIQQEDNLPKVKAKKNVSKGFSEISREIRKVEKEVEKYMNKEDNVKAIKYMDKEEQEEQEEREGGFTVEEPEESEESEGGFTVEDLGNETWGPKISGKMTRRQACKSKGGVYTRVRGNMRCVSKHYKSRVACRKKKKQGFVFRKSDKKCVRSAKKRASICRKRGLVYDTDQKKCRKSMKKSKVRTTKQWKELCESQGKFFARRKNGSPTCRKTKKSNRKTLKERRSQCRRMGGVFAKTPLGRYSCRSAKKVGRKKSTKKSRK